MSVRVATTPDGWLKRWPDREAPAQPVAPRLRLVCFPPAGGGAGFYRSWSQGLPAGVDLVPVRYPGREDRLAEDCVDDLRRLAAGVIEALVADPVQTPVVLFGHSMGAWVAYEVALGLARRPRSEVRDLHVSAAGPPHEGRRGSLHLLDDTAMWESIVRLGGVPAPLVDDPDARELLVPALRADLTATETYQHRPGELLNCRVTAHVGQDDPVCDAAAAGSWAAVTTGTSRAVVWPGDHFYLADCSTPLLRSVFDLPRGGTCP